MCCAHYTVMCYSHSLIKCYELYCNVSINPLYEGRNAVKESVMKEYSSSVERVSCTNIDNKLLALVIPTLLVNWIYSYHNLSGAKSLKILNIIRGG